MIEGGEIPLIAGINADRELAHPGAPLAGADASPAGYPAAMATFEELERRVEQLEEQLRHVLPAYGVSLVHEDTRVIRETLDRHGGRLGGIGTMLGEHGETLARHGEMLQEILRRLPPEPGEPG